MLFPRDQLVAALHHRGVCYLAPSPLGDEPHFTDDEVIVGLAASKDGRLRFALAGLMLIDPGIAERSALLIGLRTVRQRHGGSLDKPVPTSTWSEIQRQYLAAMYLQRMWRTRLQMAHGKTPWIPERFTTELHLPLPDAMHGKQGLLQLTNDSLFNDWSSYDQVVEMICEQPCHTVS
jgi:hypothetical protein